MGLSSITSSLDGRAEDRILGVRFAGGLSLRMAKLGCLFKMNSHNRITFLDYEEAEHGLIDLR